MLKLATLDGMEKPHYRASQARIQDCFRQRLCLPAIRTHSQGKSFLSPGGGSGIGKFSRSTATL